MPTTKRTNSKYASQSGCNRCCGCCICEGSSQNVIICHDLTTAQQKHSRLTLNKLLIAFTANINTKPVSIQWLIKNLPEKQCSLEIETKESNNEWRRSRLWRMMMFWLLSSHIQQQHKQKCISLNIQIMIITYVCVIFFKHFLSMFIVFITKIF